MRHLIVIISLLVCPLAYRIWPPYVGITERLEDGFNMSVVAGEGYTEGKLAIHVVCLKLTAVCQDKSITYPAPTVDKEIYFGGLQNGTWYLICHEVFLQDDNNEGRVYNPGSCSLDRTLDTTGESSDSPIDVDVRTNGSDVIANVTIHADFRMTVSVSIAGIHKQEIVENTGFYLFTFANVTDTAVCWSWSPVALRSPMTFVPTGISISRGECSYFIGFQGDQPNWLYGNSGTSSKPVVLSVIAALCSVLISQ